MLATPLDPEQVGWGVVFSLRGGSVSSGGLDLNFGKFSVNIRHDVVRQALFARVGNMPLEFSSSSLRAWSESLFIIICKLHQSLDRLTASSNIYALFRLAIYLLYHLFDFTPLTLADSDSQLTFEQW